MTTATATRGQLFQDSPYRFAGEGTRQSPFARSDGGRLTLEKRLDSVWEGLAAGGRAPCPVCTAEMGGNGICSGCGSCLS